MSAQVLARKWRPRVFADLIGQEHICRTLINGLNAQHLHHAYLFCGTRGVGKTTLARILAKSFSCEQRQSAEPCNTCSRCLAIDEGNYPDLIEVDAASRTGVEDTRELLEDTQFAPSRGKYKIYLIDEVHMLSNHSFNALLKTLEEPPPHILFLFATTDPQKLPITVLSRCLKFNLKPIQEDAIIQRLEAILNAEKVQHDAGSLRHLARQARGSMRDALSLTDQAIAYCRHKLEEKEVAQMLGVAGIPRAAILLGHLVQDEMDTLLGLTERIENDGGNFVDLCDQLLEALQSIAVLQVSKTEPHHDERDLKQLAGRLTPEEVQLYYQIILLTKKELPWCPSPRRGFEMSLLRMLSLQPILGKDVVEVPKRVNSPKTDNSQPQSTLMTEKVQPEEQNVDGATKEGMEKQANQVKATGQTEIRPNNPIDRAQPESLNRPSSEQRESTTEHPPEEGVSDAKMVTNAIQQEGLAEDVRAEQTEQPEALIEDARDEPTKQTSAAKEEAQDKTLDLIETTPQDGAQIKTEDRIEPQMAKEEVEDPPRTVAREEEDRIKSQETEERTDDQVESQTTQERTRDLEARAPTEESQEQSDPTDASEPRDYTDPYRWDHLVRHLDPALVNGELRAALYHSRLVSQTRGQWVVHCGLNDSKVLIKEREALRDAIMAQIKQSVMLEIESGAVAKTPYLLRDERKRQLVQATKRDPVVKMLEEEFDGELDENSVHAAEPQDAK